MQWRFSEGRQRLHAGLAGAFELSRGGDGGNVRSMEGLRGFAVFMVFLVHYSTLSQPWVSSPSTTMVVAKGLHTIGNAGVDLFFVLSGYLIYGSLIARQQSFIRFMRRRIERIYPTFTVVLALYIFLSFASPEHSKIPAPLWSDGIVYLFQNFLLLPGLTPIVPIITVAWSLSYEMFYYLSMPAAIWLGSMRAWRPRWRIAFFAALMAMGLACFMRYGGPIRMAMFIAGIFLYETEKRRFLGQIDSWLAASLASAGLAAMLVPMEGAGGAALKVGMLFLGFFVLCYACFSRGDSFLAKAFCWTPLRWLGNMSYSYYLIHGLSLKLGFGAVGMIPHAQVWRGQLFFWVVMPIMFAFTLIPSTILFLTIERPFSLKSKHNRNEARRHGGDANSIGAS